MDNFLDRHQIGKLNQDQINHPHNPITSKEIEVLKSFQSKKFPRTDGFSVECYLTFKDLIPILFKLFHRGEREGTLPNSSVKPQLC